MALYRQATQKELPKKEAVIKKEADHVPKNEASIIADALIDNTVALFKNWRKPK